MTADVRIRLALMHRHAAEKVAAAHGSLAFWQEVEANLEAIGTAKLAGMAPVNCNLLGLAMMLMQEVKRLHGRGD